MFAPEVSENDHVGLTFAYTHRIYKAGFCVESVERVRIAKRLGFYGYCILKGSVLLF